MVTALKMLTKTLAKSEKNVSENENGNGKVNVNGHGNERVTVFNWLKGISFTKRLCLRIKKELKLKLDFPSKLTHRKKFIIHENL